MMMGSRRVRRALDGGSWVGVVAAVVGHSDNNTPAAATKLCAPALLLLSIAMPTADAELADSAGNDSRSYEIDTQGVQRATILLSVFLSIVVVACCVCCSCFYRVTLLQRTLRASRTALPAANNNNNRGGPPGARMGDPARRAQQESDEGWGDVGQDGALGFQSAILQAGYASFAGADDDEADGDKAGVGDLEAQQRSRSNSSGSAVRVRPPTQREMTQTFHRRLITQIQHGTIVAVVCAFVITFMLGPVMLIIGSVCLANGLERKGLCGPAG